MKNTAAEVILEVNYEAPTWQDVDFEHTVMPALSAMCDALELAGLGLSVLLCSDARISELNAEFRGKDHPTNVLSWPGQVHPKVWDKDTPFQSSAIDDPEIGDLALAYEIIQRQAQAACIPFENHMVHLTLHGVLHCLGFDHETDVSAAYMEDFETKILARTGIPDPYIGMAAT
ncbi:MAG: rRNA maturation RNase YbeY [Pseudomonadota bacterium]